MLLGVLTSDFFNINIGNVITWAALLGTMFAGWQKIKDRLDHHEMRMEHVEKELDILAAKGVPAICALHDKRLAEIESWGSRIATIEANVMWIRDTMQRNGHHVDVKRKE